MKIVQQSLNVRAQSRANSVASSPASLEASSALASSALAATLAPHRSLLSTALQKGLANTLSRSLSGGLRGGLHGSLSCRDHLGAGLSCGIFDSSLSGILPSRALLGGPYSYEGGAGSTGALSASPSGP